MPVKAVKAVKSIKSISNGINFVSKIPAVWLLSIILLILVIIYVYLYFTLPKLYESFISEKIKKSAADIELEKEYSALKKKYKKNTTIYNEINKDLKKITHKLHDDQEIKNKSIYENKLLEYDLEKAAVVQNKIKSEGLAIKSYYDNLQKEYIRIGKQAATLRESISIEKEKCSLIDTMLAKTKRDNAAVIQENKSTEVQIEQLKKQFALADKKRDPVAKILQQKIDEREKQKKEADKKLAEVSAKMKLDLDVQEKLKKKITLDEDKLKTLTKEHSTKENTFVKIQIKLKSEEKEKDKRAVELKQTHESLKVHDKINSDLQKDVDKQRKKYEDEIKHTVLNSSKISTLRSTTLLESQQIKKLQAAIAKIKKEELEQDQEKDTTKPCSLPVSYLSLTKDGRDRGTDPKKTLILGDVQFTTVEGKKCAYFDNSKNTYIKIPSTVHNIFSISFWFYIKSSGNYTMVSHTDAKIEDPVLHFDVSLPGKIQIFNAFPKPWALTTNRTNLNLKQWYNITYVLNGNKSKSYINGNFEGDATGLVPMPERKFFILGRAGDNSKAADVCIRHFAVWNRIITEKEIEEYYDETANNFLQSDCKKNEVIKHK